MPSTEKDLYLSEFQTFARKQESRSPGWLAALRKEAVSQFTGLNFPTAKQEEWRYTSVLPLLETPFNLAEKPEEKWSDSDLRSRLGAGDACRLVFVNGFYSQGLSRLNGLTADTKAASLSAALAQWPSLVERYLGRYAECDRNIFTALNTSFVQDGLFLFVPQGESLTVPLHVVYLTGDAKMKITAQPRNLIVLEKGARVTVIETYAARENARYFTNAVTEIVLGPDARLDHYRIQRESAEAFHISDTRVRAEQGACFSSFAADLGGRLARNQLKVSLEAENGECHLNGLYLADGSQHVDNQTLIDHLKPHGTSRQLYKGILDGEASGVFSGKILVRKDAQKTDAEQKNKNLLLSRRAKVDTKPQLEIFADDVKCAHGAAIGQLNEEEIFYFKSRGIGERHARRILTYGFASEMIARIEVPSLKQELDRLLAERLREGAPEEAV